MLSQDQGNQLAMEKGLSALSLHPLGNHAKCTGEWCLHREDPYDKPLTNTELQEDIPQIFARPKKHSAKLSQLGSTQSNKSFDRTVASKGPDAHIYSRSIG